MKRNKTKQPIDVSVVSTDFSNVVDLSAYRRKTFVQNRTSVFYLNSYGERLEQLQQFPSLQIEDIRNSIALRARMMVSHPAIVLLESTLSWANSIETIQSINHYLGVPLVMICEENLRRRAPGFLKQAFAAGLQDTLFCPLCPNELEETLSLMIKLNPDALQNH